MISLTAKIEGRDTNANSVSYNITDINPEKITSTDGWNQLNTAFRSINSLTTLNYMDTKVTAVYSITEEVSD